MSLYHFDALPSMPFAWDLWQLTAKYRWGYARAVFRTAVVCAIIALVRFFRHAEGVPRQDS